MKLFIGNLASSTTEGELRDAFESFGPVLEIVRPVNRETGRPRKFAFVSLTDAEKGNEAIEELDGSDFNGQKISVNEAEERNQSPSPPAWRPAPERTARVDDRPTDSKGKKVVYKSI